MKFTVNHSSILKLFSLRSLKRKTDWRSRAEHLQAALLQIAQSGLMELEEGEFYRRIHASVNTLLDARNFRLALLSDDQKRLSFPYVADESGAWPSPWPLGLSLTEYAIRQAKPFVCDHEMMRQLAASDGADGVGGWNAHMIPASWVGVPLSVDGKVIGLLELCSYDVSTIYTEDDKNLLDSLAAQVAVSVERRRSAESLHVGVRQIAQDMRKEIVQHQLMQNQLAHQASQDALTGLANRRYMYDRIEQMQAAIERDPRRCCALLHLNVDRFRSINDSLGHLAGDEVLREIARRLAALVVPPNVVARLSGDEFAVLLDDMEMPMAIIQKAQSVMSVFGEPFQVAGRSLQISASMGIAVCDARCETVDQLLHEADIALYRAKRLDRRRFELFDPTMAIGAVDVLSMENELRRALQLGQFEPYFQPICSLENGAILGYEALIRWNHPARGVLTPADFLRVAKDCNLIETIDWQMFELTFRAFARHGPEDAFLTFNVSALHLAYEDFDARLISLLERTGLRATRVIMEITEEVLLSRPDSIRDMLTRLGAAGIGAALDDFGTGYSSLHYLHALPLRALKIDRVFVEELDGEGRASSATVVAAILALARALDVEVIAEGIETPAQRNVLANMGCRMGQGYFLGRPVSATHDSLRAELPPNPLFIDRD